MSVPTKTRREIIKETSEWIGSNRQTKEQINSLNEEWVLLEDHQKEIERREKLREKYYEDWLSPRQQERFIGIFNDFISEYEELIVRGGKSIALEVVVSELKTLRECFGVGGAK